MKGCVIVAAKKYKPLTKREKKFNKELKDRMIQKGIVPPPKPRLNRKKFIDEALKQWENRDDELMLYDVYLLKAIYCMIGHRDSNLKITKEGIGVAKVLLLAVRFKEFSDKLRNEGKKEFTVGEQYEFIKDILDA